MNHLRRAQTRLLISPLTLPFTTPGYQAAYLRVTEWESHAFPSSSIADWTLLQSSPGSRPFHHPPWIPVHLPPTDPSTPHSTCWAFFPVILHTSSLSFQCPPLLSGSVPSRCSSSTAHPRAPKDPAQAQPVFFLLLSCQLFPPPPYSFIHFDLQPTFFFLAIPPLST